MIYATKKIYTENLVDCVNKLFRYIAFSEIPHQYDLVLFITFHKYFVSYIRPHVKRVCKFWSNYGSVDNFFIYCTKIRLFTKYGYRMCITLNSFYQQRP